ncbi:hypothetical protein [Paracoccus gahaiensis]|uniref:hypothetical protein n=1 Tax=Paracoccus gahaiensis TaxID=1706839 RepID=UPI001FE39CDE|nr:hypothetical protein [Paracoccus gahaiensis]
MRLKILGAAACAAALASAPKADAYAIDCAILLCLAGGFPASTECTAAKVEMIRRVTPFPIEPPLQLWNCPMGASGMPPLPNIGSDGLSDEIRGYRDGLEIYHVDYEGQRNSGGVDVRDSTQEGFYDENGDFRWVGTSLGGTPSWVQETVGYRSINMSMTIQGIAMRTRDYEGQVSEIIWQTY